MILYWVKRGLGFVHIHKTAANLLKAWLLFNKQNREFIGLGVIPLFFLLMWGCSTITKIILIINYLSIVPKILISAVL